jgi:hypothetical protein
VMNSRRLTRSPRLRPQAGREVPSDPMLWQYGD